MTTMTRETPVQVVEKVPFKVEAARLVVFMAAEIPLFFYAFFAVWTAAQWFAPFITDPTLRLLYAMAIGRVVFSGNLYNDFEGYVNRQKVKDPEFKGDASTVLAVIIGFGTARVLLTSLAWLIAWLIHLAL